MDDSNNSIILAHCMAAVKILGPEQQAFPYKLRTVHERQEGVTPQVKMPIGPKATQAKLVDAKLMVYFTGQVIDVPDCERLPRQAHDSHRRRRGKALAQLVQWLAPGDLLRRHSQRPGTLLPAGEAATGQRGGLKARQEWLGRTAPVVVAQDCYCTSKSLATCSAAISCRGMKAGPAA